MITPNRRAYARLSCDIQTAIFPYARQDKIGEGRIVDIALGGAQIRCGTDLQKRVPYRLRMLWKDRVIEIDSRVAREVGSEPGEPRMHVYGMAFNASSSQEFRLRPLIEELRSAGG